MNRVIQRSRAQRVVLLLDCCYGGAFERGVIARSGGGVDVGDQFRQRQLGEGRGRVVITASTAMEYAFEGARLADSATPTPSVFTGALVEGIRSGDADRNQDGHVSLSELYDFVYDRVRERSPQQTPSKWEFGLRGDLVVARNPNRRVRPAALAPELVELVGHPLAAVRLAAVRELAQIVESADVARVAGARLVLADLAADDSRQVSSAAAEILTSTRLRLSSEIVDLGTARVGGSPVSGEVTVLGGPLALASTVTADEPLRARLNGTTLHLTWTAREPGDLDAAVNLDGPAGRATVRVIGTAPQPAVAAEPVKPAPTEKTRSAAAPEKAKPAPSAAEPEPPPVAERTWFAPVLMVAALAILATMIYAIVTNQ